MEIIPRKGIGSLLFGMTKSDVIRVLGHPEEIDNDDNDWWYEAGTSVSFCEEGLDSIEIFDENLTLFGTQLASLTIEEIQAFMERSGYEVYVQKVETDLCVTCEMLGLFFVFFENKLDYVQAISLPEGFKDIVLTA